MAGRPKKQTVDYFPHYVKHGKTIEILERRFGAEGYAAWFKLLEQLGDAEGHFIDCNDDLIYEFLTSKIHKDENIARQILDLLAKLGAIDKELWTENMVIWSQNFVDGIAEAYRNRTSDIPLKPEIKRKKLNLSRISEDENTQSRVEESREEKRKGEERRKEKISSQPAGAARPLSNSFSLQSLAKLWNEKAPSPLARVNLPFSRKPQKLKTLEAALKRHNDPSWWDNIFLLLHDRPFLLGTNDRGWKATFDFVIDHAEEILDGKYSGTKAQGQQQERMAGPLEWFEHRRRSDAEN